MKLLFLGLAVASAVLSGPAARATVTPNGLFTDGAVLQRGTKIPVFGTADNGEVVKVSLGDHSATATAHGGTWRVELPAMQAGGPYTLTVSGPSKTVTLHNVLVGDVWVCSGQSNMEFGIGNLTNAAQEIAQADYPQIRLFTVAARHRPDAADDARRATGLLCTPQNVQAGRLERLQRRRLLLRARPAPALARPHRPDRSPTGAARPPRRGPAPPALSRLPDFRAAVAGSRAGSRRARPRRTRSDERLVREERPRLRAGRPLGGGRPGRRRRGRRCRCRAPGKAPASPNSAPSTASVWFRKDVDLPADAAGKEATLHLGPVDDDDTTWVNGDAGRRDEGYDRDRALHRPRRRRSRPGRNVIAVRVLDTGGNGGIYGQPAQMHLDVTGGRRRSPGRPLALQGRRCRWRGQVGACRAASRPEHARPCSTTA